MPDVNIIDAGTPLPGADALAPLWTDQCDASTNLVNTLAPAPLEFDLGTIGGVGTQDVDLVVPNLDQIDHIEVTGTLKGKLGDVVNLTLKHETLGSIPILTGKEVRGNLSNAYPLPAAEVRTFLFGEVIPAGYQYAGFAGPSVLQTVILPENVSPNTYFYETNYYGYYSSITWQPIVYTPQGTTFQLTVPAHRYPYSPDYNYDNAPGDALVTGGAPLALVFRGFRYIMASTGPASPRVVSTKTFIQRVSDSGPGDPHPPAGVGGGTANAPDSWTTFNAGYSYQSGVQNAAFSESLYTNYNAHDWIVTNVVNQIDIYHYTTSFGINQGTAFLTYNIFTVQFLRWDDVVWNVTPLANVTWQGIFPPAAIWQFYPPDYQDYLAYSERSENIDVTANDWRNSPADGNLSLILQATSEDVPVNVSPTVTPALINLSGLKLIIFFRTNYAYATEDIAPTQDASGATIALAQGNLRPDGDDRAFIGILCGINGSKTMGILCGYGVLRNGRTGEVYTVAYTLATTCNINHVNFARIIRQITYAAKNWGDVPFSTRGDAGEAGVMGPLLWRIYPVRGQIGLKVRVSGSRLDFNLLGQFPNLPFIDATVPLITNFVRLSLNA